jgi:hypothetical protein
MAKFPKQWIREFFRRNRELWKGNRELPSWNTAALAFAVPFKTGQENPGAGREAPGI